MNEVIGDWTEERANSRRDARHPIIQDCAKRRIHYVLNKITSSSTCLELGAGDGFFSLPLSEHFQLTVTDASEGMLNKNPYTTNAKIMDAAKLSFDNESFEVLFEANMLHHVLDEKKIVQEMQRVSSRYIIILEPNPFNPLTLLLGLLLKDERKSLSFTKNFVRKLFSHPEWECISAQSYGLLPMNRCPHWFWKIFKKWDGVFPFIGLDNIFIFARKGK